MILWETNFNLDEDTLTKVIAKTKEVCNNSNGTYSSYHIDNINDRPEIEFVSTYYDVIEQATKCLSLYHRASYSFSHWIQVYERGGVHVEHDHYNAPTFFSWVHFVKPTSKKCFHFIDSLGNRTYPKQNAGDFIVFPSWALHAVDPNNSDDERVVIAGNVDVSEMFKPSETHPLKVINSKLENGVTVSQIIEL